VHADAHPQPHLADGRPQAAGPPQRRLHVERRPTGAIQVTIAGEQQERASPPHLSRLAPSAYATESSSENTTSSSSESSFGTGLPASLQPLGQLGEATDVEHGERSVDEPVLRIGRLAQPVDHDAGAYGRTAPRALAVARG
jgi:hypothetical protein